MKFVGRKLSLMILAVVLAFGISFFANAETLPSGNPAMEKPTKEQIAQMYNTWYYFNSSGAMVTGNLNIGGKLYKFNSSGACLNP